MKNFAKIIRSEEKKTNFAKKQMRNEKFNSEIEGTRKKQGRSFFDPKLAAVKTDQLNLF